MKTEESTDAGSAQETLLGIYLNDHLAVLTLATDLAQRAARGRQGTAAGATLDALAGELAEDRSTLLGIMGNLGVPVRQYKVIAARAAERIGRLKPNGHLIRRSPLSNVVEVEAMLAEVEANGACWRTLQELAVRDTRLDPGSLARLVGRTHRQVEVLEQCRRDAASAAFGTGAAPEPGAAGDPLPREERTPPADGPQARPPSEQAKHPAHPRTAEAGAAHGKTAEAGTGKGKTAEAGTGKGEAAAQGKTADAATGQGKSTTRTKSARVVAEESGALGEVPADLPEPPSHSDLPLPDYDHLPVGSLKSRVRTLDRAAVEQLLAYERAHADRLPVVIVLQRRLAELTEGAQRTSGVSPATAGPDGDPPPHAEGHPGQPRV